MGYQRSPEFRGYMRQVGEGLMRCHIDDRMVYVIIRKDWSFPTKYRKFYVENGTLVEMKHEVALTFWSQLHFLDDTEVEFSVVPVLSSFAG